MEMSQKMLYEEMAAIEKDKYHVKVSTRGSSQSEDNIADDLYESSLEIHLSDDHHDPLSIFPIDFGSSNAPAPEANFDKFSNLSMFDFNRQNQKPLEAKSLKTVLQ
jgi:hypothetical protein